MLEKKLAAIEAIWETERSVSLQLFAWPNERERRNDYSVSVPKLGSLILTHDPNGTIRAVSLDSGSINRSYLIGAAVIAFLLFVALGFIPESKDDDKAEPELYVTDFGIGGVQAGQMISLTRLGTDHPDVAATLSDLGFNYLGQKRYAAAEPHLRAALAIYAQKLGDDWRPDRSGILMMMQEVDGLPEEHRASGRGINFVILGGENAIRRPGFAAYVITLVNRNVAVYLSADTPKTLINSFVRQLAAAKDVPAMTEMLLHLYRLHEQIRTNEMKTPPMPWIDVA